MAAMPRGRPRRRLGRRLGMTRGRRPVVRRGGDAEMGRCILALYRSAAQPAMTEWGRELEAAERRPALVIIATEDHYTGGEVLARRSAERFGAEVAVLDGLGHWWMLAGPRRRRRRPRVVLRPPGLTHPSVSLQPECTCGAGPADTHSGCTQTLGCSGVEREREVGGVDHREALGRSGEGDVEGAQALHLVATMRAGSTTTTPSSSRPLTTLTGTTVTGSSRPVRVARPCSMPGRREGRRDRPRPATSGTTTATLPSAARRSLRSTASAVAAPSSARLGARSIERAGVADADRGR